VVETAIISFLIGAQVVAQQARAYRIQQVPVRGGAELVTVYGHAPTSEPGAQRLEIPLVSVLRDTVGSSDPDSARLRYVWILTSTRPTLVQRTASALSFVWFRTGGKQHANQVPSPVLDLASPAKSVWSHLAGNSLQALQFDGLGMTIRSSTRSYRGNFNDYRQLQIYRALGALNAVEQEPANQGVWAGNEFINLYSRLNLADRTFGGLVREENLPKAYDKEISRREEIRGHNWELLRQRAELNGLYFDPLALPGQAPTQAMLWIARDELDVRENHPFDRQFLGIANPWTDQRLAHWTGYSETRYFDEEHRPVPAGTPGSHAIEMIPLALYSLDYPRVPLLLADFRSSLTAKKRELLQHASTAVLTGVLGITSFGNWTFLAANTTWTFVRGRHGAPTDRSERLRSYSEAREFVEADDRLAPDLRTELFRRLDHLALNPLENAMDTEARVAREQFAALMQYAQTPDGLAARLERDRRKELQAYTRSRSMQLLSSLGGFFRGPARDSEQDSAALRSELEARRLAAAHERFLRELLASSPRPEVVRDPSQIRQVIQTLSGEPFAGPDAPHLIAQVFERSRSVEIRMACLAGLRRLDVEEARSQLVRLSQDPKQSDFWRAVSLASFKGDREAAVATGFGQF
jgi:hypothetical protein